jgi:hypothetical protein
MKVTNEITIHNLNDRHDIDDFLEACMRPGGAHVYAVENPYPDLFSGSFVVSSRPMTQRAAQGAADKEQAAIDLEIAIERLQDGTDVAEVWREGDISAADLSRAAKKAGVKLPRNWFAKAYAENKAREDAGLCVDCGKPLSEHDKQ